MNFKNKKLGRLRFWWSKAKKVGKILTGPSLLLKCSDCENSVRITYPIGKEDDLYEINGVIASRKEWQPIFKRIKLI